MFLCSNMCPQHDCFTGFHSKKNSERLEGLFHRRIFLPAVLTRHLSKTSRDILLRQNKYAVCTKMNNLSSLLPLNSKNVGRGGDVLVSVGVKAPTDKPRSDNGS